MTESKFQPFAVAVLTVSDTRTTETDTSGSTIVEMLETAGHKVVAREIQADDREKLTQRFQSWIEDPAVEVVISTGGTGITRRDVTPEALEPLVTKAIDGFGELFRTLSFQDIGAATIQSRAVAAICKSTLAFALPGSTGAVRLAMEKILIPQLDARTRPCNFAMLRERW